MYTSWKCHDNSDNNNSDNNNGNGTEEQLLDEVIIQKWTFT